MVDGVLFTQPKPHEGGRRQPYLGFLMDEAMSGMTHQDRAIAMGHSHAGKVGEVSPRMGEDMGMMYVRTVVGPRVLYDMELTGGQFQGERLRKVWEKLLL